MIPSHSDLRYFEETAATGHMARAARKLGLSQPALTVAIQRLERALGVTLLVRSRKGVSLTPSGRELLSGIRELSETWSSLKERVGRSQLEVAGTYRLGCHPEVAIDSLPLFLPDLLERHPRLEIQLVHDLSRKVTEAVIDFRVDVGIVVNPAPHPDLLIRTLSRDEMSLWVGPGKRATQAPSSGDAILVCDPALTQTRSLLQGMKRAGIRFGRILATGDLQVATSLVASGAGMGMLPSEVALRHPALKLKRVAGSPVIRDEVALVSRVENQKVRAIRAICDSIVEGHRRRYGAKA